MTTKQKLKETPLQALEWIIEQQETEIESLEILLYGMKQGLKEMKKLSKQMSKE
jgi:hypothetical protein